MSKIFYHVSEHYLGKYVTLKPKIPETSVPSIEGNIPRICVSTKIPFCIRSICGVAKPTIHDVLFNFKKENGLVISPAVYITGERAYIPPKISDFRRNEEHWILKKCKFEFLGYIDIHKLMHEHTVSLSDRVIELDSKILIDQVKILDSMYLKYK